MRSTTPLRLLCAPGMPDYRINMHPNEGADLGLMMTSYSVTLGDGGYAELHLRNDCPKESVEVNPRFWERLGKPSKAVLTLEGEVLRIEKR